MKNLRYSRNTVQAIGSGSVVIVNFDDHDFGDDDSDVTVGAGWVFTAPIDGVFLVNALVQLDEAGMDAGEVVRGYFYKNAASEYMKIFEFSGTNTLDYSMELTALINCVLGDTINFRMLQNSGASVNLAADGTLNKISVLCVNP